MSEPSVVILTNDDGVDAPGLAALRDAAEGLGVCRVVAPLGPQSGCGHAVTTHRAIGTTERPDGRLGVDGTPADCVRVALHRLGSRVGWVISGINAGGNLGADLHHSGTVAAVREAALRGVPGVAVSHYLARGRAPDWALAARWLAPLLRDLMSRPPGPGRFWNVNLPHPESKTAHPEVVFCQVDESPLPLSFRDEPGGLVYSGDYQARPRQPGRDVAICFGGRIAVSEVHVIGSEMPAG